ncbi:polysaccharide deacetylase family protein [Paenibacillus sp. S3N08]|uniref:Polysaccharide deacetylase family protein n=2 Tax=Paenibacillus agricola TaxID=2716264 RepID=A0ABX0J6X0_9BACL|nr:polysaccharide deacetylase family protein [Paenibacillus agricola]
MLVAASILLWTTGACGYKPPQQAGPSPQSQQQPTTLDGNSTSYESLSEGGPPKALPSTPATSPKPTPKLQEGKENQERENVPLTLADLHQKYRSTFLFNGPSDVRQAALTFDDVPDTVYTNQILDVLKQYGVKATFFVVGNRAEAHPEVVTRIMKEGHAIGNHSYSHPNLAKTDDDKFRDEVLRTEQILAGITGYTHKLFRPPYGNVTEPQILWLASQNYHIINWNVDSLDWKGLTAEQVTANVLGHVVPGAVILQHGAGGEGEDLTGTVQALPIIIEKLIASHIQLVTVPEIFKLNESTKVNSPIRNP